MHTSVLIVLLIGGLTEVSYAAMLTAQQICKEVPMDIGFVLDSSGSVGNFYQNEKDFIKDIATAFFHKSGSNRAGVVTFSDQAETSISLGTYLPGRPINHTASFRTAVDDIGYHKGGTRIDAGLEEAENLLSYTEPNRYNVQKLVVLLTDGETRGDPIPIADRMRRSGIMIIVIGIGNSIDVPMLRRIGGSANYYAAASFTQLSTNTFVDRITEASCETIYLPAKDGKFYKLYKEAKTFDTARTFCQNEGSHLIIADSQDTMKIIRDNYASLSIWLGAQYNSQQGVWHWSDGQPLDVRGEWGQQGPRGNNICLTAREGKLFQAPCTADHVFVCQKGVSKPDPPVLHPNATTGHQCVFSRKMLSVPTTYEVSWYSATRNGQGEHRIYQQELQSGNVSRLPTAGLNRTYGNNIYCKLRMWYTNEANTKSAYAVSNSHYEGIELQPWFITVTEGKPAVEVKIRPTVPIKCRRKGQSCGVTLVFTNAPDDIIVSPCTIWFTNNDAMEWKTIKVKAKTNAINTGVTTRKLRFTRGLTHILPTIRLVYVADENTDLMWHKHSSVDLEYRREGVKCCHRCSSSGDPHIRTFDGVFYDHYYVGDYVLVKSYARDFEVHVRTQKCGRVSCNCGVTVKEGDDVLSINMCGKNSVPNVRYLSNREPQKGTRIEQSPNGKTFIIKLASTAFVKFVTRPNIADITVQLPAMDFNQTAGLCGSLDNNPSNDFMDKNGVERNGCGKQASTEFTESWKIAASESLFCFHGGEGQCREADEIKSEENEQSCNHWSTSNDHEGDNLEKGYRKMAFPGQRDCDTRRNSLTLSNVIVLPESEDAVTCAHHNGHSLQERSIFTPSFPTASGLSEKDVTDWCRGQIESSNIYEVCKEEIGDNFSVDGFVSQCIEDAKIMDHKNFGLLSAVGAMESFCGVLVLTTENFDYERLQNNICPNECSFQGNCQNGTCICNEGFTSEDCSVAENQVPELVDHPTGIFCDMRKLPCSRVKVRSNKLIPGDIECGVWSNDGVFYSRTPAELISFGEVVCDLPEASNITDKLFATTIPTRTYVIYLSNNKGVNYSSSGIPVTVYDSKCMKCLSATVDGQLIHTCELRRNSCYIDGYCYGNGEVDPNNPSSRVCDSSRSTSMFLIGEDKPLWESITKETLFILLICLIVLVLALILAIIATVVLHKRKFRKQTSSKEVKAQGVENSSIDMGEM